MVKNFLREFSWRLGRRLYQISRYDLHNNPRINGEYWLIEELCKISPDRQDQIFLDIGANIGDWTQAVNEALCRNFAAGTVYAFEPSSAAYLRLLERFKTESDIRLYRTALSESTGSGHFYVNGGLSGTNSLHASPGSSLEIVPLITLDDFLIGTNLERIDLVKCDAEGHDLSVLRGAAQSLNQGKIGTWQFEYNHRWIKNRAFLKDVFDFIQDKPYQVGKLINNGVQLFDAWHPELERFFESNYVLVCRQSPLFRRCRPVCFNSSNVLVDQ